MEISLDVEKAMQSCVDAESVTYSHQKTLDFLFSIGALKQRICGTCRNQMKLSSDPSAIDGYRFICYPCKIKINIRSDTIFELHKYTTLIILTRIIFYYYEMNMNAKEAYLRINQKLPENLKIGYKSVKTIYADLRKKIKEFYNINASAFKLGGAGMQVEIDESAFTHLPLKKRKTVWGVGIIDRTTGELRIVVTDSRSKEFFF